STAVPWPSGVSRKCFTSVVLPAPRKPVTTVTGIRAPRSRFCRRPKRPAAGEGKSSCILLLPPPRAGEGRGGGRHLARAHGPPPAALRASSSSRSRIYPTSANGRCQDRASPILDASGGEEARRAHRRDQKSISRMYRPPVKRSTV